MQMRLQPEVLKDRMAVPGRKWLAERACRYEWIEEPARTHAGK
jgi:hypothetical protein